MTRRTLAIALLVALPVTAEAQGWYLPPGPPPGYFGPPPIYAVPPPPGYYAPPPPVFWDAPPPRYYRPRRRATSSPSAAGRPAPATATRCIGRSGEASPAP